MKSMTGYGRSSHIDDKYEIDIEIKSVNNKSFAMNLSCFKELYFLENDIKDYIFKSIKRGKIDIRIYFQDKNPPEIQIDEHRLKAFYDTLQKARDTLGINQEIQLSTVINQPDILISKNPNYDSEVFKKIFFTCLKNAVNEHQTMAVKEGEALKSFFSDSLKQMQKSLTFIQNTIPAFKEKLKENLINNVKMILDTKYENEMEKRILLEVALYIDKADITEEIVRLRAHINNCHEYLAKDNSEVGKSLNFIFQEMHREANTISSKYNTSETFGEVLILKEEVDKCKEQVANVE